MSPVFQEKQEVMESKEIEDHLDIQVLLVCLERRVIKGQVDLMAKSDFQVLGAQLALLGRQVKEVDLEVREKTVLSGAQAPGETPATEANVVQLADLVFLVNLDCQVLQDLQDQLGWQVRLE